jgi:glycosyltransferase involved in cell wall biosynthesis
MIAAAVGPRVLHVITSYPPEFSGHGLQLQSLIPCLSRLGVRSEVLASRVAGNASEESSDACGIRVRRLPRRPGRRGYLRFAVRTCGHVARRLGEFDIVHYHGADWPAVFGIPAVRGLGGRTVLTLTLLGVDDPRSIRAARLGRLRSAAMARAHRVIALSGAMRAAAVAAGWKASSVRTIPVGVDVDRFAPASAESRTQARAQLAGRFGFDPRGPLVCFVGALIRRKGIDLLARAWASVAAAVPQATLLLVGPARSEADNGEFSTPFAAGVLAAARPPSIVATGPMEDPAPAYRAADLFVLPSRGEGMPNVLLEACASGLAVVVTDLPGVAGEVVEDGRSGLVVPREDADALASAMIRLLADPGLRASLAACARARVAARFDLRRVAADVARVYGELSGAGGSGHA